MTIQDWLLPCIFKEYTGVSCPWCGLQRGTFELLGGDLWGSIQLFPPLIPIIAMLVVLVIQLKYPFKHRLTLLYICFASVILTLLANFIIKNNLLW